MAQQYISKSLTASSVATMVAMNTEFILEVTNNSLTTDLYVSFETDVSADYIKVAPGTSKLNLDIQCANLYYKTLSGSASFDILALQR